MAIQITFPVDPVFKPTIDKLTDWVEQQSIITIEDWELTGGNKVTIVPMFPEQIHYKIDAELEADFEQYLCIV